MDAEDRLRAELAAATRTMNWALKSEAAPRINGMLDLARSEPSIPITHHALDTDHWLFNCPNGALELKTGHLREHRREDLITKLCPTPYRPDALCDVWLRFLDAVFQRDEGLIVFMQRLLGRCLTGDVSEQILPIFWGAGANGKSTLINAILAVLGEDYAMKAPANLLMQARGDRHPTELAQLFGMRLVVASETQEGRRLNESLVKDLTGGERIRARRMKEDFWEFEPTHKVILITNHKPAIAGTDDGIWRRPRLIPFEVRFWDPTEAGAQGAPELRQDKQILNKLLAVREGILAWLVRGCLDWQAEGLTLPDKVRWATSEYRAAEDQLGHFIAECCLCGKEHRCTRAELYAAYERWAKAAGEEVLGGKRFGEAMTERGFKRVKSSIVQYDGIAVRSAPGGPEAMGGWEVGS